MDWSTLIDTAGAALSVASGGIFGLIGSIIGIVTKYYQTKQEHAWQKEKWAHEKDLLELNMRASSAETENELAIVSQTGSWSGLTESLRAEQAIGTVHMFVNDVRALFRPFLTVALWVLGAWVFYHVVIGSLATWLAEADIKDIIRYMVYTVFFCAASATMWWFGDRALSPPGMKSR